MHVALLREALIRIACSLLAAVVLYLVWLAVVLVTLERAGPVLRGTLWLLAPPFTAAGFTAGITLFDRVTRVRRSSLVRTFVWPLGGCALGATAVFWLGPMPIVFGMFAAGTASVILRELAGHTDDAGARTAGQTER